MITQPIASSASAEILSPRESDSSGLEYSEAVALVQDIRDAPDNLHSGQVRHWSLPASQISADFFCAAEHPKNGWFGLLADTAGHGLPSAIFSLQTPMLFRDAVRSGLSLPEIFERIHGSLMRQRLPSYFVCGLLVRICQRDIEIVNAGMPDALLLAPDGRLLDTFPSQHLPFGVEPVGAVTAQRHHLARGEEASLLLYSDGLVDLGGPVGDAFGDSGVLAAATAAAADTVVDRLIEGIAAHGYAAHDDISIVVIQAPLSGEIPAEPPAARDVLHIAGIDAALRIVENYHRGLMLTDAEQRILYVNPTFSAITGYSPAEAFGQTPRLLDSGRQGATVYQQMWQALKNDDTWSGELWNRRKDGTLYLEWADIRALRDDAGIVTHYLAAFTDITQKEQQDDQVQQKALYDTLTGLANKVLLADRGEQALRGADRAARFVAVLFIDLDRFNTINDSLGHDIGDQVLAAVALRLVGALREDDTLSRFGGDEFVCLLADIAQRQDASLVAGKLLAVLDQPIEVAGHKFKIGASIGISAYPSDGQQLDDLIILAGRAMERAKEAGGNIFQFYNTEMTVAAEKQFEMETRLDAAIRNGELELHYQPQMDLHSREIVGAEALVRWRDPQRGLVPPGAFIPVAEKSDLIARIGSWVLTQACTALSRWDGLLPAKFHVAVNVSPMQLTRCDLVAEVKAALAASGIDPARLQLEVTESLFIKDTEGAARTLHGIVALGVSLALDDFGTGYSNLVSLSHLPLHTFKLDQGFVRGIEGNSANSAIAKAVWHLAVGLDKEVVAEGIETCDECRHLKTHGYRTGQGYKFGKPMAEDDFLAHLAGWQPEHCPCPDLSQFMPMVSNSCLSQYRN